MSPEEDGITAKVAIDSNFVHHAICNLPDDSDPSQCLEFIGQSQPSALNKAHSLSVPRPQEKYVSLCVKAGLGQDTALPRQIDAVVKRPHYSGLYRGTRKCYSNVVRCNGNFSYQHGVINTVLPIRNVMRTTRVNPASVKGWLESPYGFPPHAMMSPLISCNQKEQNGKSTGRDILVSKPEQSRVRKHSFNPSLDKSPSRHTNDNEQAGNKARVFTKEHKSLKQNYGDLRYGGTVKKNGYNNFRVNSLQNNTNDTGCLRSWNNTRRPQRGRHGESKPSRLHCTSNKNVFSQEGQCSHNRPKSDYYQSHFDQSKVLNLNSTPALSGRQSLDMPPQTRSLHYPISKSRQNAPKLDNTNISNCSNTSCAKNATPNLNQFLKSNNINVPVYKNYSTRQFNDCRKQINNTIVREDREDLGPSSKSIFSRKDSYNTFCHIEILDTESSSIFDKHIKDLPSKEKENTNPRRQLLQSELEEEMALAQKMNLPVKLQNVKELKPLNPNAKEYEPPKDVSDGFGNPYKMTRQPKGNCIFSPKNQLSSRAKTPTTSKECEIIKDTKAATAPTLAPNVYVNPNTVVPSDSTESFFQNTTFTTQNTDLTTLSRPLSAPVLDSLQARSTNQVKGIENNALLCPLEQIFPYTTSNFCHQFGLAPQNVSHALSPCNKPSVFVQPLPRNEYQMETPSKNQNLSLNILHSSPVLTQPIETQASHQSLMTTITSNSMFTSPMATNIINGKRILTPSSQNPQCPYLSHTTPYTSLATSPYDRVNDVMQIVQPVSHTPSPICETPVLANILTPQAQPAMFLESPVVENSAHDRTPVMSLQTYWTTNEINNGNPPAAFEPSTLPKMNLIDIKHSNGHETKQLLRQICEKLIKFVERHNSGSDETVAELTDELLNNEMKNLPQSSVPKIMKAVEIGQSSV